MIEPIVSIITSTYNSSHLLKYAILSILNSDFTNWELIVIGDHCTDDTEVVVNQFKDSRIRFTNLEKNSGQQATPSNVGLTQARGKYICYLNQDDMYFPWHLRYMLDTIATTNADILCANHAIIDECREDHGNIELIASNGPVAKRNRYSPLKWYLASSWFMTAEAARDVGQWKLENELYVAPSQEWMFRAWRMGKRIFCPTQISLLLILSGKRSGFYKNRNETLHSAVYEKIIRARNPRQELDSAFGSSRNRHAGKQGFNNAIRWSYMNTFGRLSILFGIHPDTLYRIVCFGTQRGGGVKYWQRTVQLERTGE